MIDNRRVGVELEISDINTYLAVKKIYEYFNLDIDTWINLKGLPYKLEIAYDQWNATFDSTINNSDGSRCMFTYMDNGNQRGIKKQNLLEDSLLSKGIEIVSPPSNDYYKTLNILKDLIDIMILNGASISNKLNDALHIHVDASDLSFKQIKDIPKKIYNIQKPLEKLLVPDTRPKVYSYSLEDIDLLSRSLSEEEFYSQYMIVNGKPDHPLYSARRIINIKPWLSNPIENKTIEFRCFSGTNNILYIKECMHLSLSIMDYLVDDIKIPFDLEEKTDHIKSLYTEHISLI